MTLTREEKDRWKPILQGVWDGIAYDAIIACGGECKRSDVIEFVCDAGRPCESDWGEGGLTREEYRVLCGLYNTRPFKDWIRKEVFPCNSYVI